MAKISAERNRRQRFLDSHPDCYFCGGAQRATTIDHVPPRACFPDGFVPEGFESPACKSCNECSTKQDQIFGFYSLLWDFDPSEEKRKENRKKIEKLMRGITNNYPEALPDVGKAFPVNWVGSPISVEPVAASIGTTPSIKNAVRVACQKMIHALYFRETGKVLTSDHQVVSGIYQPQIEGTQKLTSVFVSLLPNVVVGTRTNMKKYGDRFQYLFGYKDQEDFFSYAAQFGHGIIMWGVAGGPDIEKPTTGRLSSTPWSRGAPGAAV